jgi:xylulokinase
MPFIAGIDSSTQSTKVEVRDADSGRLVGHGWAPHSPTAPPCSEQDPAMWWRALESARAEAGHDLAGDIAGVSVAAQQHGLVVLDGAGEVLRPAKLWNDTESAADAGWLIGQLAAGTTGWAEACGSVPVAAFTITKLSWLHRTEPELFERIAHVMLPHDWLAWQLTGELGTDRGDASGTGYWSARTGKYRFDLLEIIDRHLNWADVLPPVLPPEAALGTGDNMAAALGLGLQPGDVAISLGTSGTVFAVSDTPTADATGAVCGFADATGRYLPLVCTLNATKVTDATSHLLGVDLQELDEMALATAPGSGGVVFLPYLDGERTPNRPNATGVISGLHSDVAREQLARSAFEGVVCGLLDGLDALRASGVPADTGRLFLVGGGARSGAYRQILADLAQRPVVVTTEDELVALGACVQAAARVSGVPIADVQDAWALGMGTTIDPIADRSSATDVRAAYASARDSG